MSWSLAPILRHLQASSSDTLQLGVIPTRAVINARDSLASPAEASLTATSPAPTTVISPLVTALMAAPDTSGCWREAASCSKTATAASWARQTRWNSSLVSWIHPKLKMISQISFLDNIPHSHSPH